MALLVALACATPPSTPDASQPAMLTPVEPPSPAVDNPLDDTPCMTACKRKNMARAVAAETIEADCVRTCKNAVQQTNEAPSL